MSKILVIKKYLNSNVYASHKLYEKNKLSITKKIEKIKQFLYGTPLEYVRKNNKQIWAIILFLSLPYYSLTRGLTNNLYILNPTSFKDEIIYFQIYTIGGRILIFLLLAQTGIINNIFYLYDVLLNTDDSNTLIPLKILLTLLTLSFLFDLPELITYVVNLLFALLDNKPLSNIELIFQSSTTDCFYTQNTMASSRLCGVIFEVCISFLIKKSMIRATIVGLFAMFYWYIVFLFVCSMMIEKKKLHVLSKPCVISDRSGTNHLVQHNKQVNNPNLLLTM